MPGPSDVQSNIKHKRSMTSLEPRDAPCAVWCAAWIVMAGVKDAGYGVQMHFEEKRVACWMRKQGKRGIEQNKLID